jgi:polyphosphate kinase
MCNGWRRGAEFVTLTGGDESVNSPTPAIDPRPAGRECAFDERRRDPGMETTQELAWLRFNRRVLEQTRRRDFPALERLRFLSIWSSNLDELFAARISRLFLEARGSAPYLDVLAEARSQADAAARSYDDFLLELSRLGVRILSTAELTREEKHYFGAFLAEEVAPRTDVIRADEVRNVKSEALYFASGKAAPRHLIRMPDGLPRLLEVPGRPGTYVRLGELLRLRPELFLSEHGARLHELRAIRLANLHGEPVDWSELPAALEHRIDGRVTHLEVEREFPAFWRETIRLALGVREHEVFHVDPPLDKRFVTQLVQDGPAQARFPKLASHRVRRFELAPFKCIDRRDVLIHHPYQGYEAVESFARAAAADPAVTEIRSTLYRIGDHNVLASALVAAAAAGKRVSVLLEGRARFDELTNLEWALRFRNSGVRVLRMSTKKVHAKLLWVRRGADTYVHLGTGNYHSTNGRLYSDFSLFTRSEGLARDAGAFFGALETGVEPDLATMRTGPDIRALLVERLGAEAHPGGHAILKFNHLTDPLILDAVDACAAGGGRVDLIVRTTLPRVSSGVRARSIVGRFLEHARAAAFRRDGGWEVWCGSADGMPRNFERRHELLFPLEDARTRDAVLRELRAQLQDDVNAYLLDDQGREAPRWGGEHDSQRVGARQPPATRIGPKAAAPPLGAAVGSEPGGTVPAETGSGH